MTEKDIARFWRKVNKDGPIPTHRPELGRCWIFSPCTAKDGYGQLMLKINGGFYPRRSHRLSYELANGLISEDVCVLHKCDNRSCVNPDHLFTGTQTDNISDKVKKGRQAIGACNGNVKITAEMAKAVKLLLSQKVHPKEIEIATGVATANVWNIKYNRIWRHITLGC